MALTPEKLAELKTTVSSADSTPEQKEAAVKELLKESETILKEKSGLDRKVTEMTKAEKEREAKRLAKEAEDKAELEAIRQNKLTAEQKAQERVDALSAEVEAMKKKNSRHELETIARGKLKEKGLDDSTWLNMAMGDTPEIIEAKVNQIEEAIKAKTQKEVENKLNSSTWQPGKSYDSGGGDVVTNIQKQIDEAEKIGDNKKVISLMHKQKAARIQALKEN